MKRSLLIAVATLAVVSCGGAAMADVIIANGPSGQANGMTGNGLVGDYYGQPYQETDTTAAAYIAANKPVATFTATNINYLTSGSENDGNTTLATFLGSDSATLNPSSVGSNNLGGQLMSFNGYILLQKGANTLSTTSDDGNYLVIAGQEVIDNGQNHAPQNAQVTVDAKRDRTLSGATCLLGKRWRDTDFVLQRHWHDR